MGRLESLLAQGRGKSVRIESGDGLIDGPFIYLFAINGDAELSGTCVTKDGYAEIKDGDVIPQGTGLPGRVEEVELNAGAIRAFRDRV